MEKKQSSKYASSDSLGSKGPKVFKLIYLWISLPLMEKPFTIKVASCDTSYTAPNSVARVAAFATTITVKTESIHRQVQIILRKGNLTHPDMLIKAAS